MASFLPGAGRLYHDEAERPAFTVRQIFEDQLMESDRTPAIDPDALAEIHAALPSGFSVDDRIDDAIFRAIFPEAKKDPRSDDDVAPYPSQRS